jgi:hypothetical protein
MKALSLLACLVLAQTPDRTADDEKILQAAKVGTDGPALLAHLRSLSPTAEDEQKVGELFKQLGSSKFNEREKATADLTAMGPKVIPLLKEKLPGSTLEVRMRAERCIKVLEDKSPAAVASAAVRLLKVRKPGTAVSSLLDFVPYAPDEAVAEEVLDAVYTLGVTNGKTDDAVANALKDAHPARRAIAAVLLGRFGNYGERKAVAALLTAKEPEVRYRAAQGLLGAGDRTALPVLVDSLKSDPFPLAERAEELLQQVAGKSAPKVSLTSDEAGRKKAHEAWQAWLKEHGDKVDLAKVDVGLPLPSIDLRAREVVRQFLDIAGKPGQKIDLAKVERITDIPYYQSMQQTISTREQWREQLSQQPNVPEGFKFKYTIKQVVPLADYLQTTADAGEKEFLGKFAASEVRVVNIYMELSIMDMELSGTIPVFVRVNGARARMFGVGMPKDFGPKKQ